jgi:hypothetical protein
MIYERPLPQTIYDLPESGVAVITAMLLKHGGTFTICHTDFAKLHGVDVVGVYDDEARTFTFQIKEKPDVAA